MIMIEPILVVTEERVRVRKLCLNLQTERRKIRAIMEFQTVETQSSILTQISMPFLNKSCWGSERFNRLSLVVKL